VSRTERCPECGFPDVARSNCRCWRRDSAQPCRRDGSDFQRAVSDAFIRVMRARRPDVLWSAHEAGEAREVVSEPNDASTLPDRARAAR
jgi:hypothetical protein